jgi:hypothetical protein
MRPHTMRTPTPRICRDAHWRADSCVPMPCGLVQRCVPYNIALVVAELPGKGNHPAHCFPPGPSRTVTVCDFSTTHYGMSCHQWKSFTDKTRTGEGENADKKQAACGKQAARYNWRLTDAITYIESLMQATPPLLSMSRPWMPRAMQVPPLALLPPSVLARLLRDGLSPCVRSPGSTLRRLFLQNQTSLTLLISANITAQRRVRRVPQNQR